MIPHGLRPIFNMWELGLWEYLPRTLYLLSGSFKIESFQKIRNTSENFHLPHKGITTRNLLTLNLENCTIEEKVHEPIRETDYYTAW